MQKKPGQISSNTLSLRFMQNAAKARQDQEVEAAKAKVKSEEEWEVLPEVRQSWGIGNPATEDQSVTYEQSYLPFLFPGLSNADPALTASTSKSTKPETSTEEDEDSDKYTTVSFRGRRTFGKHGREEVEKPLPEIDNAPPANGGAPALPRGARAISSHGRSTGASSRVSGLSKPQSSQQRGPPPPLPQNRAAVGVHSAAGSTGFMKPQVEAPREDSRVQRKRPSSDAEGIVDRERETKRRR